MALSSSTTSPGAASPDRPPPDGTIAGTAQTGKRSSGEQPPLPPAASPLAIVIVNYKTPEYTLGCIESLMPEVAAWGDSARVLLVDNASGDDSLPRFRSALDRQGWNNRIDLIASDRNTGFAGGNNLGIRRALDADIPPDWILLLNSDTLVHPGCLARSRATMEQHPQIGALSCMVRNRDGSVQNVCRKFPRPDRETVRAFGLPYFFPRAFGWADLEDRSWARESASRPVEWIGGAYMWLRGKALREVGLLDESFFFYGEDIELCHRLWKQGWQVWFDAAGSITHFGGGSSDATRLDDTRRTLLTWYARLQVQRQCYGRGFAYWYRAMHLFALPLRLLTARLAGRWEQPATRMLRADFQILRHRLDPARYLPAHRANNPGDGPP